MLIKGCMIVLITSVSAPVTTYANTAYFDANVLKEKAEQAKAKIRRKIAEDNAIVQQGQQIQFYNHEKVAFGEQTRRLPPDFQEAFDRKKYRETNKFNCMNNELSNRLEKAMREICDTKGIADRCAKGVGRIETKITASQGRLRSIFIESRENQNRYCQLLSFRSTLIKDIKYFKGIYENCAKEVSSKILVNSCLNSYTNIFNNTLSELITNLCTPESIDAAVSTFTKFMNDPIRSPTISAQRIIDQHIKMRKTTIGLGQILYNVDKHIREIQQQGPRQIASEGKLQPLKLSCPP